MSRKYDKEFKPNAFILIDMNRKNTLNKVFLNTLRSFIIVIDVILGYLASVEFERQFYQRLAS